MNSSTPVTSLSHPLPFGAKPPRSSSEVLLNRSGVPMPDGTRRWRSYAPGLALFLSRVRLAEQLAAEHVYGYALNNPVTYVDPDGNAPQHSQIGKQAPLQIGLNGSGNGCPRQDAYNLLLTTIRKNTPCMNAIQNICPHGLSKEVASVNFILCPQTNIECATHTVFPDPGKKGRCKDAGNEICFSAIACSHGPGQRAGDLLFEIINRCNCIYKNAPNDGNFEKPAERVLKICKIPGDAGQGGGGLVR